MVRMVAGECHLPAQITEQDPAGHEDDYDEWRAIVLRRTTRQDARVIFTLGHRVPHWSMQDAEQVHASKPASRAGSMCLRLLADGVWRYQPGQGCLHPPDRVFILGNTRCLDQGQMRFRVMPMKLHGNRL